MSRLLSTGTGVDRRSATPWSRCPRPLRNAFIAATDTGLGCARARRPGSSPCSPVALVGAVASGPRWPRRPAAPQVPDPYYPARRQRRLRRAAYDINVTYRLASGRLSGVTTSGWCRSPGADDLQPRPAAATSTRCASTGRAARLREDRYATSSRSPRPTAPAPGTRSTVRVRYHGIGSRAAGSDGRASSQLARRRPRGRDHERAAHGRRGGSRATTIPATRRPSTSGSPPPRVVRSSATASASGAPCAAGLATTHWRMTDPMATLPRVLRGRATSSSRSGRTTGGISYNAVSQQLAPPSARAQPADAAQVGAHHRRGSRTSSAATRSRRRAGW